MAKPRVFIASSGESLPLVNVLKRELATVATVVPWSDPDVFRAGHTFLDELVRLSKEFDLGLFLYEQDDQVLSRGVTSLAPRDNVIFEHGLFMSQLGRHRAFAIAPRGGVKVLSDLGGIKLLEYEDSSKMADLRKALTDRSLAGAARSALTTALEAELTNALTATVLPQLRQNLVPLQTETVTVHPGPPDVIGAAESIGRLMRAASASTPLAVEHLGLDLEIGWAILRDRVLGNPDVHDLHWRCLIIDPDSTAMKTAASDSVSLGIARERITQIKEWCTAHAADLASRKVDFECRSYDSLPVVHGFLVHTAGLLWSMSDIEGGRLRAQQTQYWEFDDLPANAHIVQSFGNWFEHLFDTGRPVWP
jgi:hypothetical protein